jgi:hypothetical protein
VVLTLTISKDALGATTGGFIGATQYFTLSIADAQGRLGPAWNTGLGSVGTTSGAIGLGTGLVGTGLGLAGAFSRRGNGWLARHPTFTAGAFAYGIVNLTGVAITSLMPTASVKVPQALAARAAMARGNPARGAPMRGAGGALGLPTPTGGSPGAPLTSNQVTASYYAR